MRTYKHWTPRYIFNRFNEIIYHQTFPNHPWLTKTANYVLENWLRDTDVGLEFGSGRSTIWFARHMKHLTSVEHHLFWHIKVSSMLQKQGIHNVAYMLCEVNMEKEKNEDSSSDPKYMDVINQFPDDTLDIILVDGVYRSACANAAIRKIKPGGLLVVDNANWFLPCISHSPQSRTSINGSASQMWEKFRVSVQQWRRIWTTSGVTDTALYFKPCDS